MSFRTTAAATTAAAAASSSSSSGNRDKSSSSFGFSSTAAATTASVMAAAGVVAASIMYYNQFTRKRIVGRTELRGERSSGGGGGTHRLHRVYDDNEDSRSSSSPSSSSLSYLPSLANFRVLSALETKDEVQRVRMAQILHDLHELATATTKTKEQDEKTQKQKQQQQQSSSAVTRLWRFVKAPFTSSSTSSSTAAAGGRGQTATSSLAPEAAPEPSSSSIRRGGKDKNSNNNDSGGTNDDDEWTVTKETTLRGKPQQWIHCNKNNNGGVGGGFENVTASTAGKLIRALLLLEEEQQNAGDCSASTVFDPATMESLLDAACTALKREPTLIDLRDGCRGKKRIAVVGDLHGSLSSLRFVLRQLDILSSFSNSSSSSNDNNNDNNDMIVIFDGDFVDRGESSLEVMSVLLLLKLAYPDRIYLLRGNHEDTLVSAAYGFQDELIDKYPDKATAKTVWKGFCTLFGALPLAAVTDTAFVVHGGIPVTDFTMNDVRSISVEQRCRYKSAIQPAADDALGELVQGLLWSDPSPAGGDGVCPNATRTIGTFFGPDVVRNFLTQHSLRYLVRGHEVAHHGVSVQDCGRNTELVTVFSHSEYPNGKGTNLGAYVVLNNGGSGSDKNGAAGGTGTGAGSAGAAAAAGPGYEVVKFSGTTPAAAAIRSKEENPYVQAVKAMICSNKHNLERQFSDIAPAGTIPLRQWCEVMAKTLELHDIPWMALVPNLLPAQAVRGGSGSGSGSGNRGDDRTVDWRAFLNLYSSIATSVSAKDDENKKKNEYNDDADAVAMEILHANHRMLLTVYKFLDTDGNGTVDEREFAEGIALLNKHLPAERQLNDPVSLFRHIDKDGNGVLDLNEFEQVFQIARDDPKKKMPVGSRQYSRQ